MILGVLSFKMKITEVLPEQTAPVPMNDIVSTFVSRSETKLQTTR